MKKGFSGMYFGILVSFVIAWAIYMFLYFFEYGTPGNAYFYTYSYIVSLALASARMPPQLTKRLGHHEVDGCSHAHVWGRDVEKLASGHECSLRRAMKSMYSKHS